MSDSASASASADGKERPHRRKARMYYKLAMSVNENVAVADCVPFDLGIASLIGRFRSGRCNPDASAEVIKIARKHPAVAKSYQVITGLGQFVALPAQQIADPAARTWLKIAELSDEEAFALAMSDYLVGGVDDQLALAHELDRAHRLYYKFDFAWMARRLGVEVRWLKALIELARLPPEVMSSFAEPRDLSVDMILMLSQRLRNHQRRPAIENRASMITADRAERRRLDMPPRSAADVCSDLCSQRARPRVRVDRVEVRTSSGHLVALVSAKSAGVGLLDVFNPRGVDPIERQEAVHHAITLLDRFPGNE